MAKPTKNAASVSWMADVVDDNDAPICTNAGMYMSMLSGAIAVSAPSTSSNDSGTVGEADNEAGGEDDVDIAAVYGVAPLTQAHQG